MVPPARGAHHTGHACGRQDCVRQFSSNQTYSRSSLQDDANSELLIRHIGPKRWMRKVLAADCVGPFPSQIANIWVGGPPHPFIRVVSRLSSTHWCNFPKKGDHGMGWWLLRLERSRRIKW